MNINKILLNDLEKVAKIHLAAFPKSALTHLGKEAVRRYYDWQLTGPHDCLAIGAFDEQGRMLGFCFGGVFRGSLSGFVSKNQRFLVFQVLKRPWLILVNPIFRDRIRLGLRVGKSKTPQTHWDRKTAAKSFGILSIAVNPAAQGQGIGRQLMDYSELYARSNGFIRMNLTVAPENKQAIRFYEYNGWEKVIGSTGWNGVMEKVL